MCVIHRWPRFSFYVAVQRRLPLQKQMATKPQNRGEDMFAGKTGVLVGCQIMRTIGTGTFGRVKLVQESTTKKIMALKCMQKALAHARTRSALSHSLSHALHMHSCTRTHTCTREYAQMHTHRHKRIRATRTHGIT